MNNLKAFIETLVPITLAEWQQFSTLTETFHYYKNAVIIKAGQISNYVYYVSEGILRFSMQIADKEKTIAFATANELVVEVYSFYSRRPCISTLEALSRVTLVGIEYHKLEQLYDSSKNWERFGRLIAQFGLLGQVMEKLDVHLKTPEERYTDLLEHKPFLLQEVNLGVIASYVGITQETLSRIRSRIRII